jgi:hypothetical protein
MGWRLFTVATTAAAAAAAAALRLNPPTVYSYRFYIQYVETNFIRSTSNVWATSWPSAGSVVE